MQSDGPFRNIQHLEVPHNLLVKRFLLGIRLRHVQEHKIVCLHRGDFVETFVKVGLVARLGACQ